MRIISAIKATWADTTQTAINCWITLDDGALLPFTATADDPEVHGTELFNELVSSDLADYNAPFPDIGGMDELL